MFGAMSALREASPRSRHSQASRTAALRMTASAPRREPYALLALLAIGTLLFAVHLATNGSYGFHRDELATISDARHLAWGYVAYPPLTPFFGRLSIVLFGVSPVSLRVFPALAQSLIVVLAGFMTAEMGGTRRAQLVAALATAVAPFALVSGALYQYVSFDMLWWVATAYFVVRVLRSGDPRWWLAVGIAVGLGMMTKYTMAFFVTGVLVGLALTSARRQFGSGWLWAGVVLSLVIFLPNLLWQIQHHFITLDFLKSIHARDVAIGRANGFLIQQLFVCTCALAVPLWLAGLWYVFFSRDGAAFRAIGWMYVVPLVLLVIAQGRFYYLAAAYPMLLAAGSVAAERWLAGHSERAARIGADVAYVLFVLAAAVGVILLPVGAVHSQLWNARPAPINNEYAEELGWPELADSVARVTATLPPDQRTRTAILAGNYGEAGALELYGPSRRLPRVLSGVNSFWERGVSAPAPETVITVGYSPSDASALFTSCSVVAHTANRYGVPNEETRDHPDILVCTQPREPWSTLWARLRRFG